ncbi:DUF2066 domain-containing protein [Ectothiorhodospira lacustris]|uniref:DUF2066 domain-containing protein n=1 Tax=Ectothiorhodospira lacustris TaxID=2899127 RepID=UPI003242120D
MLPRVDGASHLRGSGQGAKTLADGLGTGLLCYFNGSDARSPSPEPMRTLVSLRLLATLFLLSALPAVPLVGSADTGPSLGEAEVSVDSRDRPERMEGFNRALAQVVVRLTGRRDMLDDSRIVSLLEQAPRHVQQYRYLDGPDEATSLLWVRFDVSAVEQHLLDAGLPVWSGDRPALLVWLGVQDRQERRLVSATDDHPARSALEHTARERGLPLLFPLMDLEDQGRVTLADVMGGFHEPVMDASRRYGPGGVLVARVQPSGGRWLARIQLSVGDESVQWQGDGETQEAAMAQAMHQAADYLGKRLAVAGLQTDRGGIMVSVSGVSSLADYLRVVNYLGDMAAVSRLRPHGLMSDRALFLLQVRGGARDLERAALLGSTLVPESSGTAVDGIETVGFRLLR